MDYKSTNKWTVPLARATPNLASATQTVLGAYGFGLFDLFKGFRQLPLHRERQGLFSFMVSSHPHVYRKVSLTLPCTFSCRCSSVSGRCCTGICLYGSTTCC